MSDRAPGVPGRALFAAAAALIGCSCSTLNRQAPTPEPHARQFEAEITRIEREDPASPAVLSAQLTYVEFLLGDSSGPCASRIKRAQSELHTVATSPKTQAMFPDGWARAADDAYRLHLARASCGSDPSRSFDLWSAVDAARRAVELYRDAFDYRSMVIMQFDVATTLYRLGEKAAAIAALQSVVDMDREYGFRDDARVNYGVLLSWKGEPSSPEQVAALMQGFPERKVTLRFGWRTGDAAVAVQSERERLESGTLSRSRAIARLDEHVRSDPGGWNVSSRLDPASLYEPGVWPVSQGSRTPEDIFPPAVLATPSFKVSRTGDFAGVSNSDAFAALIAGDADRLIRAGAPAGSRGRTLIRQALQTTTASLSPELLDAAAVRNYSLETAMWIGATLDQGVWYKISAPLALPGIPRIVMTQSVEFAFTRTVPCSAQDVDRACVELVLHVTPDETAYDRWLGDMRADGSLLRLRRLARRPHRDRSAKSPAVRTRRARLLVRVGRVWRERSAHRIGAPIVDDELDRFSPFSGSLTRAFRPTWSGWFRSCRCRKSPTGRLCNRSRPNPGRSCAAR